MRPEQKQRILGYFIQEAKDNLDTIEQGLLNLRNTIKDPEMVNAIFRAAQSIKGGAAMLSLDSIQHTALQLEDHFKILNECPQIQVDQKLESLFLRVFDTLQQLSDQLASSFCLSEDLVNSLMSEIEPVFAALSQHLELLVKAIPSSSLNAEAELSDLCALELGESDFGNLFGDLGDLFDTTEENDYLVEASTSPADSTDADLSDFWGEEFVVSVDESENLFEEVALDEFSQLEDLLDLDTPAVVPLQVVDSPADNELAFADLDALLETPAAADEQTALDEFSQLEDLLDLDTTPAVVPLQVVDSPADNELAFADLDALLETPAAADEQTALDEFSQLEDLLDLDTPAVVPLQLVNSSADNELAFADLDALLETPAAASEQTALDEFSQLEDLLDFAPDRSGEVEPPRSRSQAEPGNEALEAPPQLTTGASSESTVSPPSIAVSRSDPGLQRAALEQTMRVPVKQLDNVSNLVGELVVYRNSLEQDQQRQRQFLDNLLHQVQQLSNVGFRMQELYERSLLEASLLDSNAGSRSAFPLNEAALKEPHATGMDFDALEMDRFTSFHTLSQEMIELIVRVRESSSDIEFITGETEQVARQFRQVTIQLQEGLTRSRMVPFAQIADRLRRAVREIALKYGKQAELHIEGRDTLIDKVILEQLYDPMNHLVNNAITHGIETPEIRLALNKLPIGQITIRAFHQGNQTVISVSDDGAGIDLERVKAKAIQKRLLTSVQAKTMSQLDAYDLLFHPGFSTKDEADQFAGRGVGMDVVKTSLNEIRGTINTDSTLSKGTTFTIRLPLTLSICKALCCLSDKARIAFPIDGVEDTMDVSTSSVQLDTEGQACISWRDSLLPLRPLKELLKYNRQLSRGNIYGGSREDGLISIVVIRSSGTFIALQVDQVLGEQEIVIKQFEAPAPKPVGIAGATILGDGRIMPIADVLELIDLAMGRLRREGVGTLWDQTPVLPETPASVKAEPTVLIVDDSITVRELLSLTFNNAGYRVEQARDGQEAWDKLRDGLPCDIIFCDIEMPRMDGLELLSRMQQDPNLSHLPIAMLTSRGAERHRQMAAQLGASAYFTKPYLEEALLEAAQRMLAGEVMVTK